MNKAVSQSRANAELARAFERHWRTPTHEHGEIFCAEYAKKIGNANVWSIAGARKSEAMRSFIHVSL